MAWGDLKKESQTLLPLPGDLRSGLTAISALAFISFAASTALFVYLTYKLIAWHFLLPRTSAAGHQPDQSTFQRKMDFALGIDTIFSDDHKIQGEVPEAQPIRPRRGKPNQFLILIFNLLLADMHQATAFLLNSSWLHHDGIMVNEPACFAQGLFVSLGDLASSMFITAIAVHTYSSVVTKYRITHTALYIIIALIWVFVYAISLIPVGVTRNGAAVGGFFVRAGAWCWMNKEYENMRLLTHYLFIFIAIAITCSLYTAIFVSLRRQARPGHDQNQEEVSELQIQLSRNPAFLIYPVIYVLCTLPLALGRLMSMAGVEVPVGYFCFAGAMIASNGSFDCLLFGTTRNVIIFASKYEVDYAEDGLNTFNFMTAAPRRRFGNMVWIEGGKRDAEEKVAGGWWTWNRVRGRPERRHISKGSRSVSQESLRGPAIQMETVTSVVVEMDADKERDLRYPDPATSSSPSVVSSDRGAL
ncbi:hypothetical protein HJFPF1_10043 [Paramyrothecium foliicola]|nr:hypothetical protein HJFPF1_10043 [Paramyrothecium foliicola]